jgi:hypothetical protein
MTMNITGIIEANDYIAAQWVHMRPRKSLRIVLYGLLIIVITVYGIAAKDVLWDRNNALLLPFWLLTLGFGYFVIFFGWFIPFKTKRVYRQHTSLQKPFTLEITEEWFRAHSEEGETHTQWSELHKWKEGKKIFLIYRADNMFHMIPKRLLNEPVEMNFLRTVLQQSMGKEST